MLFSILKAIAGMLFKIEPCSAFIRKGISFNRAFTHGMGLMVLSASFIQLPFPGYQRDNIVLEAGDTWGQSETLLLSRGSLMGTWRYG